jgi:ATP-dependent protease ClpP protease subunit|uniref:ATP dependent Clp protease n=1 Tax=Myoviridae sp. ctPJU6 TaxID=2827684 RepID=A0A8S5TKJ1_9CAUD|nr:MAG TPA: Putative ATP dependent Clp protease [Myoviridae sp. ctPJU6]DAG86082.1 MAG TPA: Putative ATP dependent Clp protease [Caudoviricetes sp.]
MEIRITGEINDTESIVKLIESAVADIDLYINSPGGDVFAGLNVVNAIQKAKVQVTAHVEVMAASIAGVIALACDKIEIDKNSLIMLHNCWTVSSGNKKTLEQDIKAMEAIDNILHNIISENSTDDSLIAQIEEGDVWLTGEEVAKIFTNAELVDLKKDYALCAYSSLANLVKENKKLKAEQEEEPEAKDEEEKKPDEEKEEEEQPEEAEEEPKQEEEQLEEEETEEQPEEEKEQEEKKKEDYKVSDKLKDLLIRAGGI